MDINHTDNNTAKVKAEEKPASPNMEMVKEYLLDGVIEKTYTSPKGMSITLRVPSQGQLMQAIEEVDKEVFAEDANVSVDRMQIIRNNNMIALYTKSFGKRDFSEEQGPEYNTKTGFLKRKDIMVGNMGLNVFAMEWAIHKLTDFQNEVAASFEDDNLKKS